jgi:hypothetical protein
MCSLECAPVAVLTSHSVDVLQLIYSAPDRLIPCRYVLSNDSMLTGTIDDGRALLSSTFLGFCAKVRNDDPSILPELGKPFGIRRFERERTQGTR